ncbi:MAG: hypothetical protein ABI361_08060 [Nitrososphaera sp.]|jgi:hypothetical protein
MSTRETKSLTFRLDDSVLGELQKEADQREISLNVLTNQILRRYSEWDRYENKIGMMPVPKVMLSTLIDRTISVAKENGLKDKDIAGYRELFTKEAAKAALDLMKDSVLLMKKSYNLWTVLAVLQEYMKVSGINSDHKIEAGGKHVFIIQHELGQNWSEFTAQLIKMIFEELANVRANVMSTPNTVVAEVVL